MVKIYQSETSISRLILENTVIAYQQEISPLSSDVAQKEKVKAGLASWLDGLLDLPVKGGERDSDLHYIQSVLVTTNWNKNDDVFDTQEVWKARHTPQHKPANVGHDEHEIVGHMTANWVIGEDGKIIEESISLSDLPSIFHVINGSVIYKAYQDEKLLARAQKLIEEIDAGHKFVSMECVFTGFDYAVITPDNQSKVIARNDETSFLTKHLRAYGGTGLYDGFKVGRLLRNITFTGKGFVDKPANPNSIIFDKDKFFNFAEAKQEIVFSTELTKSNNNGVCIKLENHSNEQEINMTEFIEKENANLKMKNDELIKQLAETNDRLAKSSVEKLEKQIGELEEQLKASQSLNDELQINHDKYKTNVDKFTQELVDITSAHDELKKELDKVKANELRTNRISVLVDGGIEKEVAEQKVDLYDNLSDEQFSDLASELIEVVKVKNSHQVENNDESDASEVDDSDSNNVSNDVADEESDDAEAETEVLDNIEQEEELDLSVADESDESDESGDNNIRSKLSRALASMLGKDDDDSEAEKEEN